MKQKISLMLVLCMMVTFFTMGTSIAHAEDWTLPEGTRMYKPGRTMALDFGTMTILDAGFAKQSQSIIQVSYVTVNGVTEENNRSVGYKTAKAGHALFAFKALLFNSSEQPIVLEDLNPTIRFSAEEPTTMYGYPAVLFGIPECFTLEPGEDVEIVFACTAPNAMYYGSGDLLLEFAGGAMGFGRADLGNYKSIGFTAQDGEPAGDLTEISESMEEGVRVASQPHLDEVQAEDVSLEYDSGKDAYRVHVKLRNLAGYPLIHEKQPDIVTVHVQFIDSAGDVLLNGDFSLMSIGAVSGGYTDLSKGQAGWDNSYQFVSKSVLDQAEWVCVSSYIFSYVGINSDGSTQDVDGTFTESLTLAISDILPGREKTTDAGAVPPASPEPTAATVTAESVGEEPAYDRIAVEEVFLRNSSSGWKIGFKVRNTGEEGHEIIQLNLQVLDADGDVMSNVDTNVYNLEAGQAGKTEYKRIGCGLEEVGSVRVFGYRYGTGTEIVTHFNSGDRYKLITPIIVSIDDIVFE